MAELPRLQSFVDTGWISEVLTQIKSGKEATAYCCRASSDRGYTYLLAKVYRAQIHRNFHNDAAYREGFYIADARYRRASRKHTKVGCQVDFGIWMSNEYNTLQTLYAAGADVPKPLAINENTILMEYIGDEYDPAPQLNKVSLDADEARILFRCLIENVKLWLANNCIHADLSPFNILYWQGKIKVIDFPQSVDPRTNSHARMFLCRDVENICCHFNKYGMKNDSRRIADDLWQRYLFGYL